ncbi:MAG: phosphoglycerate dehydrogenase [Armatimonadetes bacterium]|nr:phosphoglycerate dehydrogenase [Armatimonadota bacterium]
MTPSPRPGAYAADELIPLLDGIDAVIAAVDAYTASVFAACPRLKIVSRWGIGIDSIDLDAATAAGVVVCNTPGTTTEAVADYAFALLLAAARRIVEGEAAVRAGLWSELTGPLVHGKTLGLVGYGQIGAAVARRAAGFAMRVLAYDPYRTTADGAELVSLEHLLAESDFVSLHAAVTPETRGLIGTAALSLIKPSAYLINTGRGALIDDRALCRALREGRLAGAALDVFGREPLPPDDPLRDAPRCLLTPHTAYNATEAAVATSTMAADNILKLWRGQPGAAVCNPAVLAAVNLRLKEI